MPAEDTPLTHTTAWTNRTWATTLTVERPRPGMLRLRCRLDDGVEADAVAYPPLCGEVAPGDRVLLNTTAADLNLGTGGVHFVIANASDPGNAGQGEGHIIKLRYTPAQTAVPAMEEQSSPYHTAMDQADSLAGMPVACCELVSQVPGVLAGLRYADRIPRVAVVVTDEAALPVAFSDLLADLRLCGFISSIVTTGQAFGGDYETVNLHSGLLGAKHVADAEVAIVTPGPGTAGTGTRWGFGAVRQGEALNAVHCLGGRPVAVIRASSADQRDRHRGISHHTHTNLTRVALAPLDAAWPQGCGDAFLDVWEALVRQLGSRVRCASVTGAPEALDRFEALWHPWTTMGRGRCADPLYYEAAAAAGIRAAQIWEEMVS